VDESQRHIHPDRNKLFNCLGAPNYPIVEMSRRVNLQAGDVMLLCSDGLWSVLPEELILQQMRDRTIVRAVPELLSKAVSVGGKHSDNVTALAMMWEGGDENPSTVTTNALPVGALTTTIQATIIDTEHSGVQEGDESDSFDEADIEKAIEEIRNAIQKSSKVGLKT